MVFIYLPCPNKKIAYKILKILLEEKLVGCGQVLKADSFYFWHSKLVKDLEYVLILKTFKNKFKYIEKRVKEIHPYKIPAILMIKIEKVNLSYKKWLANQIK